MWVVRESFLEEVTTKLELKDGLDKKRYSRCGKHYIPSKELFKNGTVSVRN